MACTCKICIKFIKKELFAHILHPIRILQRLHHYAKRNRTFREQGEALFDNLNAVLDLPGAEIAQKEYARKAKKKENEENENEGLEDSYTPPSHFKGMKMNDMRVSKEGNFVSPMSEF